MVEAHPARRHGVGIDVVQEILGIYVAEGEVELPAQLPTDELRVLGEKEDPLAWSQADELSRKHRTPSLRDLHDR